MELFNKVVNRGSFVAKLRNDDIERISHVWDEFTQSRHYFTAQGVAGVRRMFVSVSGTAEKRTGETV